MTNEHYEAVLEDLERQRDELDVAINAIRQTMGRSMGIPSEERVGKPTITQRPPRSGEMRSDEFFGMSIVNAAKKYLSIVRKPTPAPTIAREIKAHGLLNNSKGFPGTVYSLLYRESEKPNGSIIKMPGNEWALAEWYPNRPKPRKGAVAPGSEEPTTDDEAPE
jgi:hypothetical protein